MDSEYPMKADKPAQRPIQDFGMVDGKTYEQMLPGGWQDKLKAGTTAKPGRKMHPANPGLQRV